MQKAFILATNFNTFGKIKKDSSNYTYFNYNKKGYISKNYYKPNKNMLKN